MLRLRPGETGENSPPFQRWGAGADDDEVPEGQLMCQVDQPSLRDSLPKKFLSPTVKTVGYFHPSLRDKNRVLPDDFQHQFFIRKPYREGVAERFEDESVRKTVDVDLELIGFDDRIIGKLERYLYAFLMSNRLASRPVPLREYPWCR